MVYSRILVSAGSTIKAICLKSGYDNSIVGELTVSNPIYTVYSVSGYYNWVSSTSPSDSYDVYCSTNQGVQSSYSVMKVAFNSPAASFQLYIRSSSENGYDYVIVSKLNAASVPTSSMHASAYRSATIANTGTNLSSYNSVSFSDISAGDYFYVVFMKNSSDFDPVNDDKGFVLLPK